MTRTETLKQMKLGETWKFPKSEYAKWSSAAVRLYCHGYHYILKSKKENDYLEITRLE